MRFVVLGAGALGTVIAAYLARAGEDVAISRHKNKLPLEAAQSIEKALGSWHFGLPRTEPVFK